MPHLKDEWSLNYYNNYLNRILDHDAKSGLDFLNTLLEYIKAFGNIREASEAVFQHPNTVRYRIGKIKDLWGIEENAEFYYEACIFCKLHLLYKLAPFSGMI